MCALSRPVDFWENGAPESQPMPFAAIKGEKTLVELAQQFDVHPNQIKQWKDQLLDGAAEVFDDGRQQDATPAVDVKSLHVRTLMRTTGIEAIYRRPNTSKPAPGHKVYPYLLKNFAITRPNQVWAMDISYVPMARGFVYLHAYKSVPEAHAGIGRYLAFYNGRRPRSSLERKTPDKLYFNTPQSIPLAA